MANPFAFNDPFGDPFGSSNPFMPRPKPASAALPTLSPEEEQSLLGSVMEEGIGGLGYIGKILDKTFGGRAVRGGLGLLTGQSDNPSELLSFLPLSDTLGLTKERNAVQGTDLLANAGVITPGDTGWQNQLAGVASEIALDPATYLGAPAIKAVAGAYGTGAKGLARLASAPVSIATGGMVDPFAVGARWGNAALDKGELWGRALFDRPSQGRWLPESQGIARDKYTPALDAGTAEANRAHAAAVVPLEPVVGVAAELYGKIGRGLRARAEGFAAEGDQRLAAAGLTPEQMQLVYDTTDPYVARVKGTRPAENAIGANTPELLDSPKWATDEKKIKEAAGMVGMEDYPLGLPSPFQPKEYAPRTAANYPDQLGWLQAASKKLSGSSGFQEGRLDFLRGIPGSSNALDELAMNPALSGASRTLSDLDVEEHLLKMMTGASNPLGTLPLAHPVRGQATLASNYLKGLPPEAQKVGLYNTDFLGDLKARDLESVRMRSSGEAVGEAAARFNEPIADLQKADVPHMSIPEFLQKADLVYKEPGEAATVMEKILAADPRLGVSGPGAISQLRNQGIRLDVAEDVLKIGTAFKVPESIAPVVAAWDSLTNFFKTSLTTLFPAFHTRNTMSGLFNQWRANALSPEAIGSMTNVIRGGQLSDEVAQKVYGMSAAEATMKFKEEMIGNNLAFTRNNLTSEAGGGMRRNMLPSDVPHTNQGVPIAMPPGAPAGWTATTVPQPRPLSEDVGGWLKGFGPQGAPLSEAYNPFKIAGVTGEADVFRPVAQARKLGNSIEDMLRGSHYLGRRMAGDTVDQAVESVMKYQLNYADLSQFEKGVMRRVMPWYSYSRRTLPNVLEDLATNPGKLAGSVRVATGARQPYDFIPGFVGEGASLPIPGSPEGGQRYVSSFGLPFEDESIKAIGSALHGDPTRTLQQIIGMGQPIAKLPIEAASGVQLYSGRKLEDLRPSEYSQLGGLLPEDRARQLSQVVANSPLSRFGSSLDKLIDERKGSLPTLLNLGFGSRISDIDLVAQRDIAAREALKQQLHGMPGVRSREDVYVPADQIPSLSPEVAYLYSLLRKEEKVVADAQKAKKKQAQGVP